jgi:ribosomal protein S18 acetylase RimI-like enzyme
MRGVGAADDSSLMPGGFLEPAWQRHVFVTLPMPSSAKLSFRTATAADDAFLFRLYATTRADEMSAAGWTTAQQEVFLRSQFTARQHSYRAAFPSASTTVILSRQTPIGAFIVNRSSNELRIVDIALLPAHRGRGIGGDLLRSLQEEARTAKKPLRLSVLKNNQLAQQLYLRLGFAPIGEDGLYLKLEWRAPGRDA